MIKKFVFLIFFMLFVSVKGAFSLWFDYKDSINECSEGKNLVAYTQRNIYVFFTKKRPDGIKHQTRIDLAKENICELFDKTKNFNFLEFFDVKNLSHIFLIKDIIKDLDIYNGDFNVYFGDQADDLVKKNWFEFYENLKKTRIKNREIESIDQENDIIYFKKDDFY